MNRNPGKLPAWLCVSIRNQRAEAAAARPLRWRKPPLRGRWSMNGILIVVCCAVFALDLLLASLPSTRTAAQISQWVPANPGAMEQARKSGALEADGGR